MATGPVHKHRLPVTETRLVTTGRRILIVGELSEGWLESTLEQIFREAQAVEDEPPRGSPPPGHAMAASDPGQVDRPLGLVREQNHLTLLATWQGFVVAPVTGQLDCAGRHGRAGPLNSDLRAL